MTHYDLVASNKRRSILVVAGFMFFITVLSYLVTQVLGYDLSLVGVALIFSGLMSFASYYYSDSIILTLSGARPATRQEFFDFFTVAENLAMSQKIPVPKLYVIDDSAMNAFATGRDPQHAVIVATTGLLSRLNRSEIEGVVAHELSHVINYDMLLMSIVTILVGMVALLSDFMFRFSLGSRRSRDDNENSSGLGMVLFIAAIILALLSPLIAQLIQLAISRRREFLADASGVAMTKNPQGLINALQKLDADKEPLEAANKATAHLYITNPLKNRKDAIGWFAGLFETHPPIASRVEALKSI